jgi:hypothetical protein
VTRRRKASGQRWSARSTLELYDRDGTRVGPDDSSAAKLVVRWRCDGRSRRATFTGAVAREDASALQSTLAAASANNWEADDCGMPAPSSTSRSRAQGDGTPELVAASSVRVEAAVAPLRLGGGIAESFSELGVGNVREGHFVVPVAGDVRPIRDVDELVRWYLEHVPLRTSERAVDRGRPLLLVATART